VIMRALSGQSHAVVPTTGINLVAAWRKLG
jgi:hypothetical protein